LQVAGEWCLEGNHPCSAALQVFHRPSSGLVCKALTTQQQQGSCWLLAIIKRQYFVGAIVKKGREQNIKQCRIAELRMECVDVCFDFHLPGAMSLATSIGFRGFLLQVNRRIGKKLSRAKKLRKDRSLLDWDFFPTIFSPSLFAVILRDEVDQSQ